MRNLFFLWCFFLVPGLVSAQSNPQDFFEPNFVDPASTPTRITDTANKVSERRDVEQAKKQKPGSGFFEFEDEKPKVEEKPKGKTMKHDRDDIVPEAIETGDKVTSIRLLASSEDKTKLEHFTRIYTRLLSTREVGGRGVTIVLKNTDPKDAFNTVINVYNDTMQDSSQRQYSDEELQKMTVPEVEALIAQDINNPLLIERSKSLVGTQIAFKIPDEVPVKMLPTWVLDTESGAIILEGLEDPSSMITKNGKFLPPQGVDEASTQMPTTEAGSAAPESNS